MTPSRPRPPRNGARPKQPRNLRFVSNATAVNERPLDAFELPPTLRALVWPFDSLGAR